LSLDEMVEAIKAHDKAIIEGKQKGLLSSSFACVCGAGAAGFLSHSFCIAKGTAFLFLSGSSAGTAFLANTESYALLTTIAGAAVGTGAWWLMRREKAGKIETGIAVAFAAISSVLPLAMHGHIKFPERVGQVSSAPHGAISLEERWARATEQQKEMMNDMIASGMDCKTSIEAVCGQTSDLGVLQPASNIPRPSCLKPVGADIK
jgi:hypothetical protein